MKKKIWKCGIAGGVVLFLVGILSWTFVPWQTKLFHQFTNEHKVYRAIQDNVGVSGIYLLPNVYAAASPDMNQKDSNERTAWQNSIMADGPVMFASVLSGGISERMTIRALIVYLVFQIIGATIATWFLNKVRVVGLRHEVGVVTLFGATIAALGLLPFWAWWGFPLAYIAVCFAQFVIAWLFAGFVIAKIRAR